MVEGENDKMKKNGMNKWLCLYAIPPIYLINWLQFFSYGKTAAVLSFALFLYPFLLCVFRGWEEDWRGWLKGSALQFLSNMAFTLVTNQFNIVGGSGGTWRGATGIFYAEQFVLVLTFITFLLQMFIMGPVIAAGDKRQNKE